jgi:hypothetical protein
MDTGLETVKTVRDSHPEGSQVAASSSESWPVQLSVVMLCLNESLTWGTCIQKTFATMECLGIRGEVIVADNGSTDGSQAIADRLEARVVPISARSI